MHSGVSRGRDRAGKVARLAVVLLTVVALGGCAKLSRSLGIGKGAPDEFLVVTKAPLVVPPDYNLRPPSSNNPAAEDINTRELAFAALFPEGSRVPAPSRGELALLRNSGAIDVDPDARQELTPADHPVVQKGAFTREILYGRVDRPAKGPTIKRHTPKKIGR